MPLDPLRTTILGTATEIREQAFFQPDLRIVFIARHARRSFQLTNSQVLQMIYLTIAFINKCQSTAYQRYTD